MVKVTHDMTFVLKYSVLIFSIALLDVTSSFRGKYKYYQEADGWVKGHEIPLNFQDAMIMCRLEGAVLASPLTDGLDNIFSNLTSYVNIKQVYTGINALYNHKYYSTVEGIPIEEVKHVWKYQEDLRLSDGRLCVAYDHGYIERVSCEERYPYLCYRKRDQNYTNECGTFDDEYVKYNATGKCYKYHVMNADYENAYVTCQAEGGHLLTLNDVHDSDAVNFIKNKINLEEEAFNADVLFGYRVLGSWYRRPISVQGDLLDYSNFDHHRDRTDQAYCGALTTDLQLKYVDCYTRHPFICKKDPENKEYE